MTRLTLVLLAAALLGGCDGEPKRSVEPDFPAEPERSVEWYLEHTGERETKLRECTEQAKTKTEEDGNCARAWEAERPLKPTGPQTFERTAVSRN